MDELEDEIESQKNKVAGVGLELRQAVHATCLKGHTNRGHKSTEFTIVDSSLYKEKIS